MQDHLKTHIRRWFEEVWNQGREEAVDELMAPEAIAYGLGETERDVHGPPEFKHFLRNMRSAIPDVHIEVDDIVVEGDKAAARVTLTGTHLGEGLGVRPTGHSVRVSGIVIIEATDGRIVKGWNCWDQLGFLRQIGASAAKPAPASDRFLSRT